MDPWARTIEEVARELRVNVARGLSPEDGQRRRTASGRNVVVRDASRSVWAILGRQFGSIVVALLAAAAAIAFATRDPAEGFAILGVLLINAAAGFAVEWRSE